MENRNNNSPLGKGNPGDTGQDKASVKKAGESITDLNYKAQLADKYTEGTDKPASHLMKGPNRNTDKTKLDKPAYGGS